MMEKITIIGAGIGGLTLAIALQKKGLDFEIYESFFEFKDLGAGIMLANNAMQVFQELGIADLIDKEGYPFKEFNIVNKDFSVISNFATDEFSKVKIPSIAIHRSKLQNILINQIPESKLNLGKKLKSLTKQNEAYQLVFENETIVTTTTVIGADGIHSKVREEIKIGVEKRNANQMCWRGISKFKFPEQYRYQLFESWDKGIRFGCVQIDAERTYWYALRSSNTFQKATKNKLLTLFNEFNPIVNNVIANTDENLILHNEMKDIKPLKNWYKGNVCLIGDAAHATTPNMGQGACQSIEDALVLATKLKESKSHEQAFEAYQKYRMYKANKVITTSWGIGKISHWKNPVIIKLRNLILKLTPKRVMKKQNEFLYKL